MGEAVELHVGMIEETLPRVLKDRPSASFSLVHCDADLYSPTTLILEQMHPRLSQGGAFIVDEWNIDYFPGETVAVREFLETHGDNYVMEHVPNIRQPTLLLRKTSA